MVERSESTKIKISDFIPTSVKSGGPVTPGLEKRLNDLAASSIVGGDIKLALEEIMDLRSALRSARLAIKIIVREGHSNNYDWNADPRELTKIGGDAIRLIHKLLGD